MQRILSRSIVQVRGLASSLNFPAPRTPALLLNYAFIRHKSDDTYSQEWTSHPLTGSSLPKMEVQTAGKKFSQAFIAFGSNLGDRVKWIEMACGRMRAAPGIRFERASSLWETDPMYVHDQDKFLNGVCEISTTLEPIELLDTLQEIETSMGREKVIDKGPRNIDLDILFYRNETFEHPRLRIPHIDIAEREFVLRPLAELAPLKPLRSDAPWKTVQDYLNALPPSVPLTTVTPLGRGVEPIRGLKSDRETQVMAILNMTPDSFSDGGANKHIMGPDGEVEALKGLLESSVKRGATIVDVGGQSTAPNAVQNPTTTELDRVVPVIQSMRNKAGFDGLISIDTYRAVVAEAAVNAGADIINDISAGQLDPKMLETMARLGNTVILMHMRGDPNTMNKPHMLDYSPDGLIPTIAKELLQRVAEAEAAGIYRWRIILDPGIGFAKDGFHALEILRRLDELRDWPGLRGLPWLIGSSRKKFIKKIIGADSSDQTTYGTAATVSAAVAGGADIVRVHDVKQMAQVAKMSDAIWRGSLEPPKKELKHQQSRLQTPRDSRLFSKKPESTG